MLTFKHEQLSVGIRIFSCFSFQLLCCNYRESCEDLNKCLAMTCFGKFLHTVIAGWDDCECVRVFEAICNHTSLLKNVKLLLTSKSGK